MRSIIVTTAFLSLIVPAVAQVSPNSAAGTQTGVTNGTKHELENDTTNGRTHDKKGQPNTNSKTIASQQRHAMGGSTTSSQNPSSLPRPTMGAKAARPEGSGPTSGR